MNLSRERLEYEAEQTGFRIEILEKVLRLLDLLNDFFQDEFLRNRLALKGGTALNVFHFNFPRLSVDIDINYVGSADREIMLLEKGIITESIERICLQKGYYFQRKPSEHAGGKWILRYKSVLQGTPRLEIDLNFLSRVSLWPIKIQSSFLLGSSSKIQYPVLDRHDLAGGKLTALFSRNSARDLFDAYQILKNEYFDRDKLRLAFLIYGAGSRVDWRKIKVNQIAIDDIDFSNKLLPMLRKKSTRAHQNSSDWYTQIHSELTEKLESLLPFKTNEMDFLNALLDQGRITPELLTDDFGLMNRININPSLLWKAQHVRQFHSIEIEG